MRIPIAAALAAFAVAACVLAGCGDDEIVVPGRRVSDGAPSGGAPLADDAGSRRGEGPGIPDEMGLPGRHEPPEQAPYDPPLEPFVPERAPASEEAEAAIAGFDVPEALQVTLFAAEPMLGNPVALDVDDRGRVYVAETWRQETEGVPDDRSFPEWLEDDLRAQTVADRRAMYLRHHPEVEEEWTDRDDRIRLLVDEDGDGRADRATDFAFGFQDLVDGTGAGVLAVDGDVYYTCIPKLWKLSDGDGDGVADGGFALHDGFGVRVALRGHDLHGLTLGPDRRLYFSVGDRGYHVITREGRLLHDPGRGAVFRCALDGSGLEVFARGLRNPQELAFDDLGRLFTVDNNSDAGDRARLVYLMEGGDSGWSMNFQTLPDRGPWMSEDWWRTPADAEDQAAFLNAPIGHLTSGPSGLVRAPGVGLPDAWADSFFVADFTGAPDSSGVRRFTVEPDGAGFRLGEEELAWGGVLATDVDFGPDGSLYVSDWVEGWTGVGKGRLYRAVHADAEAAAMAESAALLASDWDARPAEELARLLGHRDRRVRLRAQWTLAERRDEATLRAAALDPQRERLARVHAIWGLTQLRAVRGLKPLLADADAVIRAQVARAFGEAGDPAAVNVLLNLLAHDAEPRVRFEAAMAAGKLRAEHAVDPLVASLRRDGGDDRFLRHASSWALARVADETTLAALRHDDSVDVRMGAVLALRRQHSGRLADFLADGDARVAAEAGRAIYDLRMEGTPAFAALADLAAQPDGLSRPLLRRALAAAHWRGTAADLAALEDFVADDDGDLHAEVEGYLAAWNEPDPFDPVLNEAWEYAQDRVARAAQEPAGDGAGDADAAGGAPDAAIARGREVFAGHPIAQCTKCHALSGVTPTGQRNAAGPDLTGVGLRLTREEIRRSITDPTAEITPGWEIRDARGNVQRISTMPVNLAEMMEPRELDDVVAFLAAQRQVMRVLVHVESQGYEHAVARAGDDGLSLVEAQWQRWAEEDPRFEVVVDRSAAWCTVERLAELDAVFFYTTGELEISESGRAALMQWVEDGGGFTGAHCATDTFYEWPAYGRLIGAYFDGHPWHEEVTIRVEDPHHLATRHLGESWTLTDEIYQFRDPYDRDCLDVLLSLDTERTPMDRNGIQRDDGDFAVAWTRTQGQGRVFYTSLGHRASVWRDDAFRRHLVEGVLWAARAAGGVTD